jgi:predicted transposase/invertase (TIGR01784 family)
MDENLSPDNILSPKNDWIFKLLFGNERNKSILVDFLQAFIELPDEEYEITLIDTHLKREGEDDKLGILDVKLKTTSGKTVDIEIQVAPFANIGKRISFYKSKLIIEQIAKGENYNAIKDVICVFIIDYALFPDTEKYVNRHYFCNAESGKRFADIPEEIYIVELPKLPADSDGSGAWDWVKFLSGKSKEDFEMVAEKNTEIRKAVDELYVLSSDREVRLEYERRQKAIMDYNTHMEDHYLAGLKEGELKGRLEERSNIIDLLKKGHSLEELEKLLVMPQ